MKLSECNMGVVVAKDYYTERVGHIVGLAINDAKETIVTVSWNDGSTTSIHPTNIVSLVELERGV